MPAVPASAGSYPAAVITVHAAYLLVCLLVVVIACIQAGICQGQFAVLAVVN